MLHQDISAMDFSKTIRIGSRKSQLAMIQTNTILSALNGHYPDLQFDIVSMDTIGDKVQNKAITKIGVSSVFTKELEAALLVKEVDLVVHSLKDLPTKLPDGLVVGCIFKRDSPYDVIVMNPMFKDKKLEDLPAGSVIGTSSLRRAAQTAQKYPHLKFETIRGNLNSRFQQLDESDKYAALVLAEAGLTRMGWENRISERLSDLDCMYAVSQGAIGVECRADDVSSLRLLSKINDRETFLQCVAERSFFRKLGVGYKVPVSVFSEIKDGKINLKGCIYSLDGTESKINGVSKPISLAESTTNPELKDRQFTGIVGGGNVQPYELQTAEDVGIELADLFLESDAKHLLAEAVAQAEMAQPGCKEQKTTPEQK